MGVRVYVFDVFVRGFLFLRRTGHATDMHGGLGRGRSVGRARDASG